MQNVYYFNSKNLIKNQFNVKIILSRLMRKEIKNTNLY